MKNFVLISSLLISSTSMAGVMTFHSKTLEKARTSGHISVETLIVKLKNGSDFLSRHSYLGEFKPFFDSKDGTWGYLKLNMLPDAESASLILADLKGDKDLLHAYFAPIGKNAVMDETTAPVEISNEPTPNFESKQLHLEAPPLGVGARAAWAIPGGTGKNVKVIDIETCFEDHHEDFHTPFYVGNNPDCDDTNHGTAVWGEIAAKNDGKGVTGIAYDSDFGIYGFIEGNWDEVNDQYISSINAAIQGAMDNMDAGDVLVIEQQMVGPDLKKYSAVEYWPHIYEQLKAATDKGIICVQAAANGNSDMDDAAYGGAFDLSKRDSGCIMVGAVGQGDFERLSFSNYGSRVDAAGFGRGVVTTGYGDLFSDGKEKTYTARFSGTSSATPIVSGVIAVVSSIAKEQGRLISPVQMRAALRKTGTVQGRATIGKRVGSFPVIQQMLKELELN
ncbi:MAG TPA: S8 family serine peptidase [Bacteriovoracaceae bacterium]|nr:S8 family serine peptidase [Bacteriovoracaceae bacterium]